MQQKQKLSKRCCGADKTEADDWKNRTLLLQALT
jgi:hypothetical protein